MRIPCPRIGIILGLLGLISGFSGADTLPELIPREVLFGNPERSAPLISPDGSMFSYRAPLEGVMNIWVKNIDRDNARPVTSDTGRGIQAYFWAGDSRHIIYTQDEDGNENFHLYGLDIQTGQTRDYTPFDDVKVRLVEQNKLFPDELLISVNLDDPRLHDVYLLDINSGDLELVAMNPGNIVGWMADADFKIRAALVIRADGGFDLVTRSDEKSEWEYLLTWDWENNMSSDPLKFSADGEHIYLRDSRNYNTARLVKVEIASGDLEVICHDPVYDVSRVRFENETNDVQAVSFEKARTEWVVLDEEIADDFERVAALDEGDFLVYDADITDSIWMVSFSNDAGPISYYVYDRGTDEATFLYHQNPILTEYTFARMEPFSFTARDGLRLHGYISFPPGLHRKDIPMVLLVHGGPWSRDSWGYNPEVQWLTNRGYICLQVNYRGSEGYGKGFLNAGNKEWGGKMQDDLEDAVRWTIKKGYADPDRVAIFGASYGGYAALAGAAFSDLFCCAVDIFGPCNLLTFLEVVPAYWKPLQAIMYKRVGHPVADSAMLRERSPLFNVEGIEIPLLIAQGANDPRVPMTESEQIVEALEDKGIEYKYVFFTDEGHGFTRPENRLEFYSEAERFLARHLGGRYEE
ncbi:alpha/beta fold hydrolase [candidate division WOR-3 bacterium]|uniref:Alpha/beta fold hydrolase n=1 Tax=candidate division WOR-3 bacterium TaxID=2052148 RepID=A0A9D5QBS1_UNCW3|nr:alpha/beta fold hydrolase [candidate division WOR-3 bacterium]MBD3363898.1 alpha/beta fold hydrolase [candidate division WOR-3 bacterium]